MTEPNLLVRSWWIPVGIAAIVCFVATLRFRSVPESEVPARSTPARRVPSPETDAPAAPTVVAPRPAPAPVPQSDAHENERELDRVLLATTYRNFRNAVATDNPHLEKALKPVLLRQRQASLKLAQEESDRATTPVDREIALRTLEALRR